MEHVDSKSDLRRADILEGINPIPFEKFEGNREYELIKQFCNSLFNSYIRNPNYQLAIPYWSDKFENQMNFRIAMTALAKGGWIESTCSYAASWGQVRIKEDKLLNYCSLEELATMRADRKYYTYIMDLSYSDITSKTKLGNELVDTGLKRVGFANAGNSQFGLDTNFISQFKEPICKNVTKGMTKVREQYPEMGTDEASYDAVSEGIVDVYEANPDELYTTGNNLSDSRGRAISSCLRKVGNPIGYKDMRALLVIAY